MLFLFYFFSSSRWVCEEIPDLKLAMENYVLIDYDTKRWEEYFFPPGGQASMVHSESVCN